MRDGLANPLINAAIGAALAARGFSAPVSFGLGVAAEVAYAAMASYTPHWFDGHTEADAAQYDMADFAVDLGSLAVGWAIVALAMGRPMLPKPAGIVRSRHVRVW